MDLNNYGGPGYDKEAISRALRPIAYKWVPALFPMGKISSEQGNRALRVGNIKGRAPRNRGSCRIWLEGEHAGDWVDFDNKDVLKGQPLSTIKENRGLNDGEVLEYAVGIIEEYGGDIKGNVGNGSAGPPAANRFAGQVEFYLSEAVQAPGTLIETYWRERKLGLQLPPCAYRSPDGSPDMLFSPLATHFDSSKGYPTMICRFRYPDGSLTGAIHLTHLLHDGSWHIGRAGAEFPKKSWGPRINGGLIMLAPINAAGELGIGEGIETTAAGMAFYGVPGWAAGDTSAMVKFGEWLRTADPLITGAIKRLLVWGDAGAGGESTARSLAFAATAAGIPLVELYFPRSGDDLAADLFASLPPPSPITDHAPIAPELPLAGGYEPERPEPSAESDNWAIASDSRELAPIAPALPPGPAARPASLSEISGRLMALEKGMSGDVLIDVVRQIVGAGLDPINEDAMINLMYRRTGIKKRAIEEMARQIKGEIVAPAGGGSGKRPWLTKMAVGNDGDPKGIMSNVAVVLREAEEIKGAIGLNDFTGMISVLRKLPWERGYPNPCETRPWSDDDELAVMEWIQGTAGIHAPRGAVFDAVQRVAAEGRFHPVREYLSSLQWDRTPRIDRAANYYFGAKDTYYHSEVFKRWLLSGVARIYRPGVKADCMTVFEGEQNIGKSTAIRILFDPLNAGWFTDQLAEMGTKDASLELRGIWCAEYSDLEGMTRAEAKTIKAYMSRTTDRFRPPYGRMPIRVERQCVFGATTNEHEYLKDATGARRFWPLRCSAIDRDALARDTDQLWAEVVALYVSRQARWWIDEQAEPELALAASGATSARYQGDAWEAIVKRWLAHNGRINVTNDELLKDALEISDKSKWSRTDQIRVGYIMRRLKWDRARDKGGAREWRYWRPGSLDQEIAEEC